MGQADTVESEDGVATSCWDGLLGEPCERDNEESGPDT